MADKPEDQITPEERIQKAKEMYARGCRNYYCKLYVEAADDLSEATQLYNTIYGVDAEEMGDIYLLYAKALTQIGLEENKLMEVPESDEEEEEESEEVSEEKENGSSMETDDAAGSNGTSNGHSSKSEPQAGTSANGSIVNEIEEGTGEEENEDAGNLEVAWEVLENAAAIFQRMGEPGRGRLIDVYCELAGISVENGHCEAAIEDYGRALDVYDTMTDQNKRIAAEIHYKVGLCQVAEKLYDDSVKAFQKASDLLEDVLKAERAKPEQTPEVLTTIKDLEETQQDILNKIIEVGDTKKDEVDKVKQELAKMFQAVVPDKNGSSNGAGPSSSSAVGSSPSAAAAKSPEADKPKPKPTDISHLIKRKKPDTPLDLTSDVAGSPAKKVALDQ